MPIGRTIDFPTNEPAMTEDPTILQSRNKPEYRINHRSGAALAN